MTIPPKFLLLVCTALVLPAPARQEQLQLVCMDFDLRMQQLQSVLNNTELLKQRMIVLPGLTHGCPSQAY